MKPFKHDDPVSARDRLFKIVWRILWRLYWNDLLNIESLRSFLDAIPFQ
jgi:hypothetical protein